VWVDLSAAVTSSSEPAQRQQQHDDPDISSSMPQEEGSMEQALMGDTLHDVSIKGLSDRAVAEYTVENRTLLFGSILRLFDVPKDKDKGDEKAHGNNSASAAKKKGNKVVKDAGVGKDEDKGVSSLMSSKYWIHLQQNQTQLQTLPNQMRMLQIQSTQKNQYYQPRKSYDRSISPPHPETFQRGWIPRNIPWRYSNSY